MDISIYRSLAAVYSLVTALFIIVQVKLMIYLSPPRCRSTVKKGSRCSHDNRQVSIAFFPTADFFLSQVLYFCSISYPQAFSTFFIHSIISSHFWSIVISLCLSSSRIRSLRLRQLKSSISRGSIRRLRNRASNSQYYSSSRIFRRNSKSFSTGSSDVVGCYSHFLSRRYLDQSSSPNSVIGCLISLSLSIISSFGIGGVCCIQLFLTVLSSMLAYGNRTSFPQVSGLIFLRD